MHKGMSEDKWIFLTTVRPGWHVRRPAENVEQELEQEKRSKKCK